MFKKVGCDRTQIDHLLQNHRGVSEENILRHLGIIEQRTNELLMAQAIIQAKVSRFASMSRSEFVRRSSNIRFHQSTC